MRALIYLSPGIKTVEPCSNYRKPAETTHSVSTADIKETLSLQERQWKSGVPGVDQDSKRFIFAEKFIPERNTSNDVLHGN
jgi:hypothetical protein